MKIFFEKMIGKWSGLGQTFDYHNGKVLENISLEVTISKKSDSVLIVENKFTYVQETRKNKSNRFEITFSSDFEFEFKPDWAKKAIQFMYMVNPISFQGTYLSNYYGENTKTLNNNFIVENQWQINIEREKADMHSITEFVLEKEQ